jgi:hypothetical protein
MDDAELHRIGRHRFRARFQLPDRDRAIVDGRGITTLRKHAEELIEHRLAGAEPRIEGGNVVVSIDVGPLC